MLNKSFKPQKCKTSLKLAMARIKLTRNKRAAQLNQLKKEVAQLLETGQDQTARIRVEHVIREEKIMSAYELIDLYIEIIVARLQIIDSQKVCPIDLKEAVSSVIFASPRCADVPELLDVRRHLAAKYGKEFVTSALEIRPDSGVNRLVVEKLSAKAPDIQTKVKVLTKIAMEHGIKWEPKAFEEPLQQPHEGMRNGPSSFESTNKLATESPKPDSISPRRGKVESVKESFADEVMNPAAGSGADFSVKLKGPSSFESASKLAAESAKLEFISQSMQKHESVKMPTVNEATYVTRNSDLSSISSTKIALTQPQADQRAEEPRHEELENGLSCNREEVVSSNQPNWGMDFKDVASAAQAAAESAERASFAARVAAELAARENDSSNDPNRSHESLHTRKERPKESKLKSEQVVQEPVSLNNDETTDTHTMNSRIEDWQKDGVMQARFKGNTERTFGSKDRSSRYVSSTSSPAHLDYASVVQEMASFPPRISEEHDSVWQREEIMKTDSTAKEKADNNPQRAFYSSKSSYDDGSSVLGNQTSHVSAKPSLYEEEVIYTSYDKGEGTYKKDDRKWTMPSDDEQDSPPHFDDDGSFDDDHVEIYNSTNDEVLSSFFQSQGKSVSNFSSHDNPGHNQERNESLLKSTFGLPIDTMKNMNVDENAGNIRQDAVLVPSAAYDTDSNSDDIEVIDGLFVKGTESVSVFLKQTELESARSVVPDDSSIDTEPVLRIEDLKGGLRNNRGFSRPPYVLSSSGEGPFASKGIASNASLSLMKSDDSKTVFQEDDRKVNNGKSQRNPSPRTMQQSSLNSDSSEGEELLLDTSRKSQEYHDNFSFPSNPKKDNTATITGKKQIDPDIYKISQKSSLIVHAKVPKESHTKSTSESSSHRGERNKAFFDLIGGGGDDEGSQSNKLTVNASTIDNPRSRRTRGRRPSEVSDETDKTDTYAQRKPSEPRLFVSESSYKPTTVEDSFDKNKSSRFLPGKKGTGMSSRVHTSSEVADQADALDAYARRKHSVSRMAPPDSSYKLTAEENSVDKKIGSNKSHIERPSANLAQNGISPADSKGLLHSSDIKSNDSSATMGVSKFAPPASYWKNISDEDNREFFSSESEASPKSPVSTSIESSKGSVNSKALQTELARTISSESKENPKSLVSTSSDSPKGSKHVHPKLPDADKFISYFQTLRANTRNN